MDRQAVDPSATTLLTEWCRRADALVPTRRIFEARIVEALFGCWLSVVGVAAVEPITEPIIRGLEPNKFFRSRSRPAPGRIDWCGHVVWTLSIGAVWQSHNEVRPCRGQRTVLLISFGPCPLDHCQFVLLFARGPNVVLVNRIHL